MQVKKYFLNANLIIISIFGLISCKQETSFISPIAISVKPYTQSSFPKTTARAAHLGQAGSSQNFLVEKDMPGEWWKLFHSQEMNQLMLLGLQHSPSLAQAKAAFLQSQENLNAMIGTNQLPSLSAQLSGQRERFLSSSVGGSNNQANTFNLFNASVNAAYTLDIFGKIKYQVEGSQAALDMQTFELTAAYLNLTASIATTVINIASLQDQIKVNQQLIKAKRDTLAITQKQYELGSVSQYDVLSQQAVLAQQQANIPLLAQALAQNQHALSVLIGALPNQKQTNITSLRQIKLPTNLPISIPSRLLQQRPDIQAALASLHMAAANVGVATANLYPQFNLTAGYGWQGTNISHLINPSNVIWNAGAGILQPIFNGGALMANKRAAVAAYQQAAATYQQVILQALQNVADILRALQYDADILKAEAVAEWSARQAFKLAQTQYQTGSVSYLNLLAAEQTYQQAMLARVQAETNRYRDTVALFQALGGGWWNQMPLAANPLVNENVAKYQPSQFGKNHEI